MPDEHPEDEPTGQQAADREPDRPADEADDGDPTASVDETERDVPADPDQQSHPAEDPEPSPDAPDAMSLAWVDDEVDALETAGAGGSALAAWADWPGRKTANEANERIFGELMVHYTDRTVSLPMDADAALRAIAGWRYGYPRVWEDPVIPEIVPGRVSWAALSLEGVLALVWLPGPRSAARPARMSVDPAVA